MEIFDETKASLKEIWDTPVKRQHAKIIITAAIGQASDIGVKTAQDILDELDRMLLDQEEETPKRADPGM